MNEKEKERVYLIALGLGMRTFWSLEPCSQWREGFPWMWSMNDFPGHQLTEEYSDYQSGFLSPLHRGRVGTEINIL